MLNIRLALLDFLLRPGVLNADRFLQVYNTVTGTHPDEDLSVDIYSAVRSDHVPEWTKRRVLVLSKMGLS